MAHALLLLDAEEEHTMANGRHRVLALGALTVLAACSASEEDFGDGSPSDKSSASVTYTSDGVGVTNLSLTGAASSASAAFTVNTTRSVTFSQLVLAVRDEAGKNFDFGRQTNLTLSGSRTFNGTSGSLHTGKYTAWVAYTLNGSSWVNVQPTGTFTVGATSTDAGTSPPPATDAGAAADSSAPPPPPPPAGKSVVFDAPFSNTSQWTVGRSSAYPGNTNPGDNKLDYISASNAPDADGTFRAVKRSDGKWDSDLVTTEYSSSHFELKPGDELAATVTLGSELGAWPAIWTWGRDLSSGTQSGHGEVDLFEYHSDNANLLELSNHVREGHLYYTNANTIKPGVPFDLKVIFGLNSVDWYINGTRVFADGKGVPSNWVAYPIVNLSVCAGQYHPAPNGTSMSFRVTNFRVYR